MKQSKMLSWIESIISTFTGFGIGLAAQVVFLPMLGASVPLSANLAFAAIMTAISIARGYIMRRIFEHLGVRSKLSPFAQAVLAERKRQVDVEGWDAAHDDQHRIGEMAEAGAAYASRTVPWHRVDGMGLYFDGQSVPRIWPWSLEWWKPAGLRRDLVKAAALIIAEGEKHDRTRRRKVEAV